MYGGSPVERLSQELGLTSEQQDKLRTKLAAQVKAQQAAMKSKMEAGMKHLQAVCDAFVGPKFDAKKAGVGSQAPDMATAVAKNRLELAQTVLSVLTPEQRPKFAEYVRARGGEPEASQQLGD